MYKRLKNISAGRHVRTRQCVLRKRKMDGRDRIKAWNGVRVGGRENSKFSRRKCVSSCLVFFMSFFVFDIFACDE